MDRGFVVACLGIVVGRRRIRLLGAHQEPARRHRHPRIEPGITGLLERIGRLDADLERDGERALRIEDIENRIARRGGRDRTGRTG